jgi:hypothetical protein
MDGTSIEVIELGTVVTFEGREIARISLDFDRCNGPAIRRAEKQCSKEGCPSMVSSPTYCMCLAAEISDEPLEALDALKGSDLQAVIMAVQAFLVGAE